MIIVLPVAAACVLTVAAGVVWLMRAEDRRDERTADAETLLLFAQMPRQPEIAHEPPRYPRPGAGGPATGLLKGHPPWTSPGPAAPAGHTKPGTAAAAGGDAGPPPPRPAEPPPLPRLTSPAAPAIAILDAFTGDLTEHLGGIKAARQEAFQREAMSVFPAWEPWPGDDTLTSMRAIKDGA